MATLRGSYGRGKGLVPLRFAAVGGSWSERFLCAGPQKTCLGRSKFAFCLRKTCPGDIPFRISYWEADIQVWVGTLFFCDFVLGG